MDFGVGQEYWCHQCSQTIRISNNGDDISCPLCRGEFVEEIGSHWEESAVGLEMDLSLLNPRLLGFFHPLPIRTQNTEEEEEGERSRGGHPAIMQLFETFASAFEGFRLNNGNEGVLGYGNANHSTNPTVVLQGRILNFPIGPPTVGPGSLQVFLDSGGGTQTLLPGRFGDYFYGPGLDMLIQQLAENEPNRYGSPPASKAAVEAMPTINIKEDHLGSECSQCAVCKDEFELGCEVRQMPCKHMYHSDCILPWLAQHSTCPVCRFEMPAEEETGNCRPNQLHELSSGALDDNTRGIEGGQGGEQYSVVSMPEVGLPISSALITHQGTDGFPAHTNIANGRDQTGQSDTVQNGSSRFSISFPWPFHNLFTPATSQPTSGAHASSTPNSAIGSNNDANANAAQHIEEDASSRAIPSNVIHEDLD
eukprot:Gb_41745 [translate_table: standard]